MSAVREKVPVHSWAKNATTQVRASLDTFADGARALNICEFFRGRDGDDVPRGRLAIRPEQLGELEAVCRRARELMSVAGVVR